MVIFAAAALFIRPLSAIFGLRKEEAEEIIARGADLDTAIQLAAGRCQNSQARTPALRSAAVPAASSRGVLAACSIAYKDFIALVAAFTVFSMSGTVCAVETNPASNCDGAR